MTDESEEQMKARALRRLTSAEPADLDISEADAEDILADMRRLVAIESAAHAFTRQQRSATDAWLPVIPDADISVTGCLRIPDKLRYALHAFEPLARLSALLSGHLLRLLLPLALCDGDCARR